MCYCAQSLLQAFNTPISVSVICAAVVQCSVAATAPFDKNVFLEEKK